VRAADSRSRRARAFGADLAETAISELTHRGPFRRPAEPFRDRKLNDEHESAGNQVRNVQLR
jgi:hypothetical protein